MNASTTGDWRIEFPSGTREGYLGYYEGERAISFYWECGGDGVVLIIHVGKLSEWRKQYPWAVDRQPEILDRVAQYFIRRNSPGLQAEIETREDGYTRLLIREPKKRTVTV